MKTIIPMIIIFMMAGNTDDFTDHLEKRISAGNYHIEQFTDNIIKVGYKRSQISKYVKIEDNLLPKINATNDMQIFDLTNISDSLFNDMFVKKGIIEVSGSLGSTILIGDFNKNNKLDFLGAYKIEQNTLPQDVAVCELQADTTFPVTKIYTDSVVRALSVTDLDNDGFLEFNLKRGYSRYFSNFESETSTSYPKDSINFEYELGHGSSEAGSETFVDLDNDGFMDLINTGKDTLPPEGVKIMVSEYDDEQNCFVNRFKYSPYHWYVPRFCYGDFDQDNFIEFVGGSIDGDVHVFENTGNDSYEYIFKDTISTPNAYLLCATNDIDKNGKPEFFVGGSSYYQGIGGTKVYWFEANGNDNYVKVRTFFLLGTDVLGTTELYNYDVNIDGVDDLVFAFGFSVVILAWNPSGYFELYYYDELENWNQEIKAVNIYDTYSNGKPDMYVCIRDSEEEPRKFTIFYMSRIITQIEPIDKNVAKTFQLFQNFPNPFNSSTTIKFYLTINSKIDLTVFDINGKEVRRIFKNQKFKSGAHKVFWNGTNENGKEVSSGIYLYQIKGEKFVMAKKMILIK